MSQTLTEITDEIKDIQARKKVLLDELIGLTNDLPTDHTLVAETLGKVLITMNLDSQLQSLMTRATVEIQVHTNNTVKGLIAKVAAIEQRLQQSG